MSERDTTVGLDIGSRNIKLVAWDGQKVIHSSRAPTTIDPMTEVGRLLRQLGSHPVAVTGHGRNLIREKMPEIRPRIVSTIQAAAHGARHLHAGVKSVLDMGGLKTRVISLTPYGEIYNYHEMDQCAASTGKYLEFLAASMQISVEDFGRLGLKGTDRIEIEHVCTLHAESEARFLVAQGHDPAKIARSFHAALVDKVLEFVGKTDGKPPIVFSGGVAENPCITQLFGEELGDDLIVPDSPDLVCALGAAICGHSA